MLKVKLNLCIFWLMSVMTVCFAMRQVIPLDGLAAVVNGQPILLSDMQRAEHQIMQQLSQKKQVPPSPAALRKLVLQSLVNRQLQLDEAKRLGLSVSKSEVSQAIKRIQQRQHISPKQMRAQLKQHGQNLTAFERSVHDDLLMMKLRQKTFLPKIQVTAKQITHLKQQYQMHQTRVHLVDWLFEVPEHASNMVWREQNDAANLMKQALISGEKPPAQVVAVKSDFGWRAINDLPSLMVKSIQGASVGSTIGPVRAPNGMHVLQLIDRSDAQLTTNQARQILMNQAMAKAMPSWLHQLREQATVEIMLHAQS